jgi:hypothetical protein
MYSNEDYENALKFYKTLSITEVSERFKKAQQKVEANYRAYLLATAHGQMLTDEETSNHEHDSRDLELLQEARRETIANFLPPMNVLRESCA